MIKCLVDKDMNNIIVTPWVAGSSNCVNAQERSDWNLISYHYTE